MTLLNIVLTILIIGGTINKIGCSNWNEDNKYEIHLHKLTNKSGLTQRYFYSSKCISLYELHEKPNLQIGQQIDLLIWSSHENTTVLITFTWYFDDLYGIYSIEENTVRHVDREYLLYHNISHRENYNIKIDKKNLQNKDIVVKFYLEKLEAGQQIFQKILNDYKCTSKVYRFSQYINVILNHESQSAKMKLENTALLLMDVLKYFPLNSLEDISMTTNIILKEILPLFDTNIDLKFLKEVDTLCQNMALQQIGLIKIHPHPRELHDQVRMLSSSFIELGEFIARNSEKLQMAITKPGTFYSLTKTEEVYLLMEIVKNLYDVRRLLADAVLITKTTNGDTTIKSNAKGSETTVIKATGKELHNRFIDLQQVRIFTSKDFQTSDVIYNTVVSNWKETHAEFLPNNPNNLVIDIEIQDSSTKKLVTTFQSPIHLYFDISMEKDTSENVTTINFTVPTNLYKQSYPTIVDHIIIHAIEIPEMETLFVDFTNFNSNHSLDVVIKKFKVPDLWDFMENITITANTSNPIIYRNDLHYSVIVYIGIIPNENMLNEKRNEKSYEILPISFDLKFNSLGCYSENKTNMEWEKDCQLGLFTSSKILHCKCHHLSKVKPRKIVANKLRVKMWDMMYRNRQLHLATSNGMMITFGFFCLLFLCLGFVFALGRPEREIYYVPDNLWADRFAYLVNVKTGFGRTAGTTSNVVIKLIGKRFSSRPHVLNFPDQPHNILQRQGNNLFIITTEKYISQITAIELWLDGRGHQPTWYCNFVKVLDLQYQSEWYFVVRKKLCYTQGQSNWIRIKRDTEYISPDINVTDTASVASVDEFTTASRENSIQLARHAMSWYAKVTLGISTVLTGYTLAQFFYDFPTFSHRMVYNEYALATGYYYTLMTFLAPLISFLIHSLIGYLFQNSASQFLDRERYPTIFSFKVTCLAWCIIITLVITSLVFIIFVQVYLPEITFYLWIMCIMFGILFQVCVYFNFFLLAGICFAFFKSSSDSHIRNIEIKNIIEETEQKRRYLHVTFSGNGLRPYLKHLYYPPHPSLQPYSVFIRELMEEWIEFFDNLIMIILYLFCLEYGFFIFTIQHMDLSRDFLKHILNVDLKPKPKDQRANYNKEMDLIGNMVDRLDTNRVSARYIGRMKVQQVRVKQQACELPKQLKYLNLNCIPSKLTDQTEEVRAFLNKWIIPEAPSVAPICFKYSLPEYTSISEATTGRFGKIPGGGYMLYISLRMTIDEQPDWIGYLKNSRWVDDHTVYLVLSGQLLDGNCNLIYFPTIIMHFDSSAYVSTYEIHRTYHLLLTAVESQTLLTCVFLVITIWIAIIVFKKMSGIIRQYTAQDFWTAVDVLVITSTTISYCMINITMNLVEDYLIPINNAFTYEFLPYSHMYNAIIFWDMFAALIIACIVARIIKLLRIFDVFKVMEKSFVLGAIPLISLLFCMAIILASNAIAGYVLFGVLSYDYFTITSTFFNLILLSYHYSSSLDFEIYYKFANFGPTGVAFVMFYLMMTLMFYNVVKTVIIMSFIRAKQYYEEEIGVNYSSKRFVSENFSKMFKKFRLSAGASSSDQLTNQISPKSNEFAFENVYLATNHDLKYLKYASLSYIRNVYEKGSGNNPITDYDYKLMKKSVELSIHKHEGWDAVQKFTKCRFSGEEYHFIDELKIDDIKKCVQAIIAPDTKLEETELLDTKRKATLIKSQKNLEAIISILENF